MKNLIRPVTLGVDWVSKVGAQLNFATFILDVHKPDAIKSILFSLNVYSLLGESSYGNQLSVTGQTPEIFPPKAVDSLSSHKLRLSSTEQTFRLQDHVESVTELVGKVQLISTVLLQSL